MYEIFRLSLTGASRRCDNPVIEQLIRLSDEELAVLPANTKELRACVERVLAEKGLVDILNTGTATGSCTPVESLGWLYVHLATGFQRVMGHRVKHAQLEPRENTHEFHAIFEYEYMGLGLNVTRLAMAVFCEAFPCLEWPVEMQPSFESFEDEWTAFKLLAADTMLPTDTEVMLMSARRMGIPCIKLEREPYQGLEGDFRIRRNSMLKLGHCTYQLVLDGMLCIDRSESLIGAYHDRMSLIKLSEIFKFIIPYNLNKNRCSSSYEEAVKLAGVLQYPVVVKSRLRSHGKGVSLVIENPGQLRAAVRKALSVGSPVLLERYVQGSTFRVLCANNTLIAVIAGDGMDVTSTADRSITAMAVKIAHGVGVGMLEMTIITPDISLPLSTGTGAVVDVDFSPRLDRFLKPDSEPMHRAITEFLRWLYPAGAQSRIPVVAITGTNGKTTTGRMISKIFKQSGLSTALCCTDGYYMNGERVGFMSDIQGDAYMQQLDDPQVQVAVMETYFGRIARLGFPWQECDVGICTNVTPDHLGRLGIESLQDMAVLKRSVPDRARHAILNADDPLCMTMLADLPGKPVTLTTLRSAGDLDLPDHSGDLNICSIEEVDGQDWVVLTEMGVRQAVIAVNDIPATHNGSARYNTSNAQQAVAASWAAGIPVNAIMEVLAGFEMSIEETPGRLNIHDNGRYKVILDFAHNSDGMRQLIHFVDGLAVKGRRVIVFNVSMLAQDEWIIKTAAESAGHFDIYICRDCCHLKDRQPGDVPRLMRQGIEAQGVASEAIMEMGDEHDALEYALALAGPGDLLVILGETRTFERTWKTILEAGK